MRRGTLATLLAAVACGTSGGSPGTPQAESPTETEVDTVPPCAEISAVGALAAFAGSPCPWTLRPTGAGVELVHSTVPPMTRSGVMPEPCESLPCTFRGVETPVGPFVIVEVPGSGSEVPAGVWLGTVEGETLSFIDLWADAGEPVIDDGIELGPPHALAPFDCEGTLALFVQPRIPGARGLAPAPALRDREGPVASSAGALDRTRCEALPLHLP